MGGLSEVRRTGLGALSLPCPAALGASRVSARRWATRAELYAMLEVARTELESADVRVRIEDMARAASLSPYHFAHHFRAAYGESPIAYHRRRLIERAEARLAKGERIGDVSTELGFASPRSFARMYRRETGRSPREFVKASVGLRACSQRSG
ncbi:MAG: helix-turn-helix transcriptional regulator [Methanoregulaceae archaeon]|nr:helix-turn-helix transcriptional regulator [Methanoregulaceae archaeon]